MDHGVRREVYGPQLDAMRHWVARMRQDTEVGIRLHTTREVSGHASPKGGNHTGLKAQAPDLPTFSGNEHDRLQRVHALAVWIALARSAAELVGLTGALAIKWAASKFRGAAADWWNGYAQQASIETFDQLLQAAALGMVGPDSFDVLVKDWTTRVMSSFKSYEQYRAWVVRTVSAMRTFGDGRMWGEVQLVDRLITQVAGTLYHEGVVVDP